MVPRQDPIAASDSGRPKRLSRAGGRRRFLRVQLVMMEEDLIVSRRSGAAGQPPEQWVVLSIEEFIIVKSLAGICRRSKKNGSGVGNAAVCNGSVGHRIR